MTWTNKWYVPSSSSSTTYTVGVSDEGKWACSCFGWTRHMPRQDCKHIVLVKREGEGAAIGAAQYIPPTREVRRGRAIRATIGKPIPVSSAPEPDMMQPARRIIDLPD